MGLWVPKTYKSLSIREGTSTVGVLDVILIDRVISQIINGIIRERIPFLNESVFADRQMQEERYKWELSERPHGIVWLFKFFIDIETKLIG